MPIRITGRNLTLKDLRKVGFLGAHVDVPSEILDRVRETRKFIEDMVSRGEVYYGVTTGFGILASKRIPPEDADKLQINLIRSHSVGVGNFAYPEIVRMALVIRLNTLALGVSGVRPAILKAFEAMINSGAYPLVPFWGSVGASGDLAPLSHIVLAIIGDPSGRLVYGGEVHTGVQLKKVLLEKIYSRLPEEIRHELGIDNTDIESPRALIPLSYKEGLALNNGTSFTAAIIAYVLIRLRRIITKAIEILSLTLEGFSGFKDPFVPELFTSNIIKRIANKVLVMLEGSKLTKFSWEQIPLSYEKCISLSELRGWGLYPNENLVDILGGTLSNNKLCITHKEPTKRLRWREIGLVQDPYSIRCSPQVYGSVARAYLFAKKILEKEINTPCDNPLILKINKKYQVVSGGNFHGQSLGLIADTLAIAISTLTNISERRTQLLLDNKFNRGLPCCLVYPTKNVGLNSGLMIAQYTSAALTAENRALATPRSVHSIPTSANQEDIVSMSTNAAIRLIHMLENLEYVLAIELLAAAQAVSIRSYLLGRRPSDLLGRGTQRLYNEVMVILRDENLEFPITDDVVLNPYVEAIKNKLFGYRKDRP